MMYSEGSYQNAIASAVALLLLAGCSVGPDYQRPEISASAAWQEGQQKGVDGQAAELAHWWQEFNDPLLNSLVERAVKSNLDLRIAEARIRESRATLDVATAGYWPSLNSSGSYTRNRASENAVGAPGQGAVVAPTGARQPAQDFFKTGFDSVWEIDVFGGTRRRVEAAQASVEASVEDRRDVLVTLLGDVAKNYIDLRGFQRRLDVAQANLKAQQESLDLTRVRFDAGLASDLEVAQSEGQVNGTAAQIPTLQSGLKQAAYRLDVLLGAQPGTLANELAKEPLVGVGHLVPSIPLRGTRPRPRAHFGQCMAVAQAFANRA